MKKFLALFLAVTMVFSLAACGSSSSSDTEDTASDDATVTEEESADAEEVDTADLGDAVTLTVINGFSETDFAAEVLAYLCDLIEEKSDGNITFERYFGGTFCTSAEEFEYISSGAVDMCALLPVTALEDMVLYNLTGPTGSEEESIAVAEYIFFDNEETAALCQAEAEASDIIVLGVQHASTTAYVTKMQCSSFQDLADNGCIYGTEIGAASFEAMGIDTQTISLTDMYESLSRGLIDSTGAGLSAVYSNKWYEVCPYVMTTTNSNATNFFTMNLDSWNSLTEAQQELIMECVEETTDYCLEYDAELQEELIATMEEEGAIFTAMEQESMDNYVLIQLATGFESYGEVAEAQGLTDEFNTIVDATLEYMGLDYDTVMAVLE